MQDLRNSLAEEQPRINSSLQLALRELPPGARPVAEHVLAAGGKRLRPFLTLLCGRALGCRDSGLYLLGAAVEMLHAATLLHDDILDNSRLRRGKPAAHTVFDPSTVILAGDAMLAKALLMVSAHGDPRLTACISEAVMRTAEGEILEFGQLRKASLSHEEYLDMITGKTAWMLRASCELGALRAEADEDLVRAAASFGLELGIAFQIVDDALDFSPPASGKEEAGTGKPRGGDLREGKLTPPLLFYLSSLPASEASGFMERFAADLLSEAEMDSVCATVHDRGFALKARDLAGAHLERAKAALRAFPPTPERDLLEKMTVYIQQRDQ
ncbi:polyprenyl synthetase family protein [Desulfovibrio sp. OttesenSCG-928-A18]|nr:polyprenyl synthetase family protein [Desulfovibrio sp. OttesenSCG-928-A18]